MNKFTAGPWKTFGEKSNVSVTAKFMNGKDAYSMPLAYMQTEGNCHATLANAKLMAAAPDLLDACQHVLDNLIEESVEVWAHEILRLQWAINKAQ